MGNTLEQELVNAFIEKIKKKASVEGVSCSFTQLETGATAIGVPDLLMFLGQDMYWIECKRVQAPVHDNNTGTYIGEIKFRPGQLRFLKKLYNAKEKAFVLALTEYLDVIIIPIFKIPDTVGTVYRFKEKGVDYTSAYEYMKEVLYD